MRRFFKVWLMGLGFIVVISLLVFVGHNSSNNGGLDTQPSDTPTHHGHGPHEGEDAEDAQENLGHDIPKIHEPPHIAHPR
jgi:hypothetical protein